MNKGEIAENYFRAGYNCAQSVVLAFSDEIGMDKDTALKISMPFGGGMGRLREVCGAVSGMFMVIGLKYGKADNSDAAAKSAVYSGVQNLAEKFKERNGSIICRELLGIGGKQAPSPEARTDEYYKKRPCPLICRDAAEILEEYISSRGE